MKQKIDLQENWSVIREHFSAYFSSSFHFAIASVGADGSPHVAPIGSLLLLREPGNAVYFEHFPVTLPRNLSVSGKVCILGVNTGTLFWVKSLAKGQFATPPAIRLRAVASEKTREATQYELGLWQQRTRFLRPLKGHTMLWGDMKQVRELEISEVVPINLGKMTNVDYFSS